MRQDPYGAAANGRRRRRLEAFAALDWLSVFSAIERVRKCRRVPTGQGGVAVVSRAQEGRAHFSGVQTCGSIWSCPCCSERILAGRTEELLRAIRTHEATGGDVLLLTLTERHDRGQALADLWDARSQAWRACTSGSRSVRGHLEGIDWVCRTEATHGEHGWHVHVHVLLFVPAGTDAQAIGEAMFAAWAKRLASLGLAAPLRDHGGLHVKRLDLRHAAGEVAEYLAKGTYDEQDRSRRHAALELASAGKLARQANRTPMQLLADCLTGGLAEDIVLWGEWERASKGRRAITWSDGARDRLVNDVEATDEELAADTDRGGQVVALIDPDAWSAIASVGRARLRARLLTAVETAEDPEDAYDRLDRLLSDAGLPNAVMKPPDSVG